MFEKHCKNIRQIEYAITQVQRDLRLNISKQNREAENVYTKLLSYLVVAWTEEYLMKLLFQPRLFSESEREYILKKRSLETKWKACLDIAISRAFRINIKKILSSLPFTFRTYYKELSRIIENDFMQSIEVRNRIAHGQWEYAFTNDLKNVSQDIIRLINMENIITIQMRMKILKTMVSIISDFCISPTLAKRDFDIKYKVIDEQVNNLHHRNYHKYRTSMIQKYQRGIQKRDEATVAIYREERSLDL